MAKLMMGGQINVDKFSLEGIAAYFITGLTLTLLGVFCLLNGVGLYSFIIESTFERREWRKNLEIIACGNFRFHITFDCSACLDSTCL